MAQNEWALAPEGCSSNHFDSSHGSTNFRLATPGFITFRVRISAVHPDSPCLDRCTLHPVPCSLLSPPRPQTHHVHPDTKHVRGDEAKLLRSEPDRADHNTVHARHQQTTPHLSSHQYRRQNRQRARKRIQPKHDSNILRFQCGDHPSQNAVTDRTPRNE
jgi:hypothetical protein